MAGDEGPFFTHTLSRRPTFILAANGLGKNGYSDARILTDHKAQQTVESGFRFLKNPEFIFSVAAPGKVGYIRAMNPIAEILSLPFAVLPIGPLLLRPAR